MKTFNYIVLSFAIIFLLFVISCEKEEPKSVEVNSISIKESPKVVEYYNGEKLDLSGLVVSLSFVDGTVEDIHFVDFINKEITCLPENGAALTEESTMVTITHTLSGQTTNQVITIIALSDIEHNIYNTIQIGNQVWMAENLKTTKYNDGEEIALLTSESQWDDITPHYCWYENDEVSYKEMYGALYNFHTIETGRLCPVGWHIPSELEWQELLDYVADNGYLGIEGKALKATFGWESYEGAGNGTNDFGFKGLPGGGYYLGGWYYEYDSFSSLGTVGIWWTSTEFYLANINHGKTFRLSNMLNEAGIRFDLKSSGHSVRCVKDYNNINSKYSLNR